jgi:hypothetical protein
MRVYHEVGRPAKSAEPRFDGYPRSVWDDETIASGPARIQSAYRREATRCARVGLERAMMPAIQTTSITRDGNVSMTPGMSTRTAHILASAK